MDIAGAMIGLALLSPLLLATAIYIKLVSSGPVFFRQQRYGAQGRPFLMWKFRTIEMDNASERHMSYVSGLMDSHKRLRKCDRELKIIRGGRLLRKLGIDELPQLFNVLRGEMSLVGPRPDVMCPESYQAWQRRRFDVVPGITGLWQVNGKNNTTFATMMRMDILYIRRRSLWLDVSILLQTVPTVIFG
jgi:lipopolysaccharide/colanic/teichoic acid biosynthesis glycosyltransferase